MLLHANALDLYDAVAAADAVDASDAFHAVDAVAVVGVVANATCYADAEIVVETSAVTDVVFSDVDIAVENVVNLKCGGACAVATCMLFCCRAV